jgi:Protein of unknown function (DUF3120)
LTYIYSSAQALDDALIAKPSSAISINSNSKEPAIALNHYLISCAAIFLVAVPVFFQAPLVRSAPWLSLILTVGWLGLSEKLQSRNSTQIWGSLIWGFSLSWFCGSVYWGWLRFEPAWHLPIEAVALPWAIWALKRSPKHLIGAWFFLGSLLGTVVTDLYFWLVGVVPHWRSLMQDRIDSELALSILRNAAIRVQEHPAILIGLAGLLVIISMLGWRSPKIWKWSFAGAVISTLIVDGIFGVVAFWA